MILNHSYTSESGGSSRTLGAFPVITPLVSRIVGRRAHHLAFLSELFSTSHSTTQRTQPNGWAKMQHTPRIQPHPRLPASKVSNKSFASASGLPLLGFHCGPVLTPRISCPPQPLRENPSFPPQSPNPLQDSGTIASEPHHLCHRFSCRRFHQLRGS